MRARPSCRRSARRYARSRLAAARSRCRRADLTQQRGFLHGGVTTALADTAAGFAAYSLMPPAAAPLTVELKINLLAPALGDCFVAAAKVVRAGRTLTICEADVLAEEGDRGTLIARLLGTFICLETTPDRPSPDAGAALS